MRMNQILFQLTWTDFALSLWKAAFVRHLKYAKTQKSKRIRFHKAAKMTKRLFRMCRKPRKCSKALISWTEPLNAINISRASDLSQLFSVVNTVENTSKRTNKKCFKVASNLASNDLISQFISLENETKSCASFLFIRKIAMTSLSSQFILTKKYYWSSY